MVTLEAAKVGVQGLVISKLDYCNAVLLGVFDQQLNKLQKIQNMGSHVFNNLGKYNHVNDSMKDLLTEGARAHLVQDSGHSVPMCY